MLSNPQQTGNSSPDYPGLVSLILVPLLEHPETLRIDSEKTNGNQRVWLRLAFESSDKGRVFGRGGRNIQALRTLLNTAATAAAQSVYLDVYDGEDPTAPKTQGKNTKRDSHNAGEGRHSKGGRNGEKTESKRQKSQTSDAPKPSLREKH